MKQLSIPGRVAVLIVAAVACLSFVLVSGAFASSPASTQNATPVYNSSVKAVDVVVYPTSIKTGTKCGTTAFFTYVAVFFLKPQNANGVLNVQYTLNGGRSTTPATVLVTKNQGVATFVFTSRGVLTADHTFPGVAQVQVPLKGKPALLSNQVVIVGKCV